MQACANEISPSLCRLFNLSLELGTFPEKWKDVNLVPIHKSESKTLVSNYVVFRFLMFYPKFWKDKFIMTPLILLARILPTGIMVSCQKNPLSQVSQVVHQFAIALERRQQVDVIYLFFSKAFDRVSHEKLLFNLECHGIRGSLLACFRSYLVGRRHRVVIDNESSDFLLLTSGVPQESILGPLLFLLFINDIPNAVSKDT